MTMADVSIPKESWGKVAKMHAGTSCHEQTRVYSISFFLFSLLGIKNPESSHARSYHHVKIK